MTSTSNRPIKLHRNAPWARRLDVLTNARLRRTYREWFAEVDGRYFRVSAADLNAFWEIEEVRTDGSWIQWISVAARNLPAVRQAIADTVAGMDLDEVSRRALSAPPAPTGQAAARIRRRQRAS